MMKVDVFMMNFSYKFFVYVVLSAVCFNVTSSFSQIQSTLNLSLIKDKALMMCMEQLARSNQWQSVNDIDKLKCHGMDIKSIEGLNSAKNLNSLSLFNNQLKEIDLRSFSKLEYFNGANNKITSVKLSNLSHLKTLYLFKNKLKDIDFTGLKQLKKIRMTGNKLIGIDISPLVSLEKAYFFDNKMEDLKVSGLPKLKFIELRQNPMPDDVYDRYDALEGITIVHDGNADDWK